MSQCKEETGTSRQVQEESLEFMLATLDSGTVISSDNISVARFRSLLDQLDPKFVENRQQITDMTVAVRASLRKDGVSESLLNIMDGMNTVMFVTMENQKYAEYASSYIVLRTQGQTHAQAVSGLRAIIQTLKSGGNDSGPPSGTLNRNFQFGSRFPT